MVSGFHLCYSLTHTLHNAARMTKKSTPKFSLELPKSMFSCFQQNNRKNNPSENQLQHMLLCKLSITDLCLEIIGMQHAPYFFHKNLHHFCLHSIIKPEVRILLPHHGKRMVLCFEMDHTLLLHDPRCMETFLLHPEMQQANTISDAYMSVIFHRLLVMSLACRLHFLHFGFKMTRNTNSKALMKTL
jgi:hypothetical protein